MSEAGVANTSSMDELSLLKRQVAEQQEKIERLEVAIRAIQAKMEQGASTAQSALRQAPNLGQVASTTPVLAAARTAAADAVAVPVASPSALVNGQNLAQPSGEAPAKSPLEFHLGDAIFKVGGFLDATAFFRTTNLGSGIGSSFGSAPFSNSTAGRLTETRLSAQNSRVSLMFSTPVTPNTSVKSYVEADFLGFQPANANITSNSNSLRLRLYWAQVTHGKFEFMGGQSWSMLTPNRTGLSPVPSDIFYSQDMDTNYQVGLTWTRQLQFRFIYHASNTWTAGVSIENAQQYVGSASPLPLTNGAVALPSTSYASQVDVIQGLAEIGGVSSSTTTTITTTTGATTITRNTPGLWRCHGDSQPDSGHYRQGGLGSYV